MLTRLLTNVQRIKDGDPSLPSKYDSSKPNPDGLAHKTINAVINKMGIKKKRHYDDDSDSDTSVKYAANSGERQREGVVVSQSSDSEQV